MVRGLAEEGVGRYRKWREVRLGRGLGPLSLTTFQAGTRSQGPSFIATNSSVFLASEKRLVG